MLIILFYVKTIHVTNNQNPKVGDSKMAARKTPLVPESRDALTKFKMECAQEIGQIQYVKENNDHYKGDLPAKVNGQQGGPIGGQMVKRMIQMAEDQLI